MFSFSFYILACFRFNFLIEFLSNSINDLERHSLFHNFKGVFILWCVTHLCTAYANNAASLCDVQPECPNPWLAGDVATNEENPKTAWEALLQLIIEEETGSEAQNTISIPETAGEFTHILLAKLFLRKNEYGIAKNILALKQNQIPNILSELIPQLFNLLLWEYKLKTSAPGPNAANNDNVSEIDLLSKKIDKGKQFLFKLIFITGSKLIKDDGLTCPIAFVSEDERRFLTSYYTKILKICQVIYKIDPRSVENYRDKISDIITQIMHVSYV